MQTPGVATDTKSIQQDSAYLSDLELVSSEVSDFTSWAHAQSHILYVKYAEKTDD